MYNNDDADQDFGGRCGCWQWRRCRGQLSQGTLYFVPSQQRVLGCDDDDDDDDDSPAYEALVVVLKRGAKVNG